MAYIVSSVVAMWLHSTAGLFPVVTGLILLCATGVAPSFRGVRFASLCIAMVLIAVLYSPQVPHLLSGVDRIALPYVPVPDPNRVLQMFREVYGGTRHSFLLLTLLALIVTVAWARKGRWEWVAFVLLGWLLAPMLLVAFSLWKPILQNKLLIWTLVPFLAACGAGLALVPWTLVRAAALGVLLASNLQGVVQIWEYVRYDWKGVSRTLERDAAPDAAVLICPDLWVPMFDHYWGGTRQDIGFHIVSWKGVLEFAGRRPGGNRGPQVNPAELYAQYSEVWFITGWSCRGKIGFLMELLEDTGQLMGIRQYGTALRLDRYGKSE